MTILPQRKTLQEKVEFRYNQAVRDDKVPSDCETMAEEISGTLQTLIFHCQQSGGSVSLYVFMELVLTIRAWRIVALLIEEDLKFIEEFDAEEEAEGEAFLFRTHNLD